MKWTEGKKNTKPQQKQEVKQFSFSPGRQTWATCFGYLYSSHQDGGISQFLKLTHFFFFIQKYQIGQRKATVCSEIRTVIDKTPNVPQMRLCRGGDAVCAVCVTTNPFTCTNPFKPSSPPPPQKLTSTMAQPALFCPPTLSRPPLLSKRTNRALLSHHLPLCAWSTRD